MMNKECKLITPENIQGEIINNEIEQINLRTQAIKEQKYNELLKENQELKEEINKISKKELKVRDMLYSIEYGTLTRERLNQIEEVLFELGGDIDDE